MTTATTRATTCLYAVWWWGALDCAGDEANRGPYVLLVKARDTEEARRIAYDARMPGIATMADLRASLRPTAERYRFVEQLAQRRWMTYAEWAYGGTTGW